MERRSRVSIVSENSTVTSSNVLRLSSTKFHKRLNRIQKDDYSKEEIEEIKALPSDWEPKSKPSKVIDDMLSRRKAEHDKCLEAMRGKMTEVNLAVEEELRERAECLKAVLRDIEGSIKESFARIEATKKLFDTARPIQKVFIPRDVFVEVLVTVNSALDQGKTRIEEYYKLLLELEGGRSAKFKEILREAYERMHEISHMLPYHIQEFFEYEIMNINQISLSNYRCYEDLRLQLILKLENDQRSWVTEFEACKRDYEEYRKKLLSERLGLKVGEFDPFEFYKDISEKPRSYICDKNGFEVTPRSIEVYALHLAEKFIEYDTYIKYDKDVLYLMIDKIFMGRYDEIQHIKIDYSKAQPNLFVSEIYDECYTSFFENSQTKRITAYTLIIMESYNNLLEEIQKELEECKEIMECALHTWDNHFERIFELKALSLVDFKHLLSTHSGAEDAEVIKINAFIDKLRQASTERELNQNMDGVRKSFEAIESIIIRNHENEMQFFDRFRDFAERESGILMLEMRMCLRKNKSSEDIDPTVQRGRASQMDLHRSEVRLPLILRFKNELKSLHNWIYGLKETMILVINKCKEGMMETADQWIQLQAGALTRKVRLKIDNFAIRVQRIYFNVYNVRLAEMRYHREIFEAHKLGVIKEAEKLRKEFEKQLPKLEEILLAGRKSFAEIEGQSRKAERSNQVAGLKLQTGSVQAMKSQLIKQVKADYLTGADPVISSIKCATFDYLNHISLFSEGGNYSAGELKLLKSELAKLGKGLERDSAKILASMEAEIAKSCKLLGDESSELVSSLSTLESEFKFTEDTLEEVQMVQSAIKATTNGLLRSYKMIERYFEQLKVQAERHLGDLNYLEEFALNAEYTEKAFKETRGFLVQDQLFSLDADVFKDGGDGDRFYLIENLSRVLEDVDGFVGRLFGVRPKDERADYMSGVLKILYDSMMKLRTMAKERFSDGVDMLKDYLIELAAKYLYYQLQCEEIWLEISLDYLVLVDKVHEFIKVYYSESIVRFLENSLLALKGACGTFGEELKIDKETADRNYYDLHRKLKPLHGHPANAKLLDGLYDEMDVLDEEVEETQAQIAEQFRDFQGGFEDDLETFQRDVAIVEEKLQRVVDNFSSSVHSDSAYLMQIKDRILHLRNVINNEDVLESCESCNIISELNLKLSSLKKGLRMSSDNLVQFANTLSLFDVSNYSSSVTLESLGINLQEIIENYKEKQAMCLEKLGKNLDFAGISRRWREMWDSDVQKVKDLYTVKYDVEKSEMIT